MLLISYLYFTSMYMDTQVTRLLTFLEVSCLPVNVFFSKFVPSFFLTSSKFTLSFCLEKSMYLNTMQVASVCVFVCVCLYVLFSV